MGIEHSLFVMDERQRHLLEVPGRGRVPHPFLVSHRIQSGAASRHLSDAAASGLSRHRPWLPCARLTSSRYCLWDEKKEIGKNRALMNNLISTKDKSFLLSKCFSLIMEVPCEQYISYRRFTNCWYFLHNPLMKEIPCL